MDGDTEKKEFRDRVLLLEQDLYKHFEKEGINQINPQMWALIPWILKWLAEIQLSLEALEDIEIEKQERGYDA